MNKELWKQMSFSQKVTWFVQYYGVATIAVIIGAIVLFSLIKTVMSADDKGDMRIIILDNGVSSEVCQVFQEEIDLLIEGKSEVSSYFKNEPVHMQAFSVRLTADDLDIVIAPKAEMQEMAGNGYLLPYNKDGITAFYGEYSTESHLTAKMEGSSEDTVFGIKLDSDSRYMTYRRNAGAIDDEEMYLGITVKKINDTNIEKTAIYLLEH